MLFEKMENLYCLCKGRVLTRSKTKFTRLTTLIAWQAVLKVPDPFNQMIIDTTLLGFLIYLFYLAISFFNLKTKKFT
jgi:hypothetical protein